MEIGRKSNKSIQEYRHNIKLLKYHLKKQQRINETLKYKSHKKSQKLKNQEKQNHPPKQRIYSMLDTVAKLSRRMKQLGITLAELFRMADAQYEGQINKGQFLKVVNQLKAEIQENLVQQLFFAIDTNLNGILDQDEYLEFLCAYGGADIKDAHRFQRKTLEKFAAQLKKKSIKCENFLADSMDPISAYDFKSKLSSFQLNQNEVMILLKAFDPENRGKIIHEFFIEQMKTVKQKNEQMIVNEEMQKDIKYMCVQWREKKINPIKIFQEADTDKKDGITPFQLEEAFQKLMPGQTKFNIKKWVKIINLNNDKQISREQFVNSIRSFYALNQLEKFSENYEKQNPNAKRAINNEQIPIEKIMKELQQKIQDSKMTKTMAFRSMDINGDGTLNKHQLTEGLKKLGFNIVFIGRVLTVFDRNCSESIEIDQWLKILGEDVQMSEVDMPEDDEDIQQVPKPKKEVNEKSSTMKKDINNKENLKVKSKVDQKQKEKPLIKQSAAKQTKKADSLKKQSNTKTTKQNQKSTKTPTTPKQPVKESKQQPIKEIKKQTSVKKEAETLKQSKKSIQKQQSAPKKTIKEKPKIQSQNQNEYEDDYDNQQVQIDVTEVEKETAIKYKKYPQQTLAKFIKFNIKNKPIISLNNLKNVLTDMGVSFTPQQAQKIFQQNIESSANMEYKSWLQRIADQHASQVQKQELPQKKVQSISQQKSKLKINRTESNMIDSNKAIQHTSIKKVLTFQEIQQKKQIKTQHVSKINNFIQVSPQLQKLRSQLLKKANKLKQTKQKFIDTAFPANTKSISPIPQTSRINNATQKVKFLKWKHYSEIYKNPSLVQGKIQPTDIIQGGLGNCYFLSALACLAQYPGLIERLFEYYDIQTGYFLVWLCIDGSWNLYEIDGNIVVNAAGTQPYFSHNNTQELWVMLLQKAYAKAYGSYEHVIGGDPAAAIRDLSGSPSESLFHSNIKDQQLWQKLFSANKNQFIMATGTDKQGGPQKKEEDRPQGVTDEGIVLGHAYSILDLHQQGRERIIQLRNPWGKIQWKGDWSDQSSKWTDKMKKKLNYNGNLNDGIFWMPFGEYFKRYRSTSINFLRENNFYQSSTHPNTQSLIIKVSGSDIKELTVTINQQDNRKQINQTNRQYVRLTVIPSIFKKSVQPLKIIKKVGQKTWRNSRQSTMRFDGLSKQQQMIMIVKLQTPTNVTISLYSSKKVDYDIKKLSDEKQLQFCQAIACQISEQQKMQTQGFKYWMNSVGSKAFLCFQNVSCPKNSVTVDVSELQNLKILSPQKNGKNKLSISRGDIQSIRAQIIDLKQWYSFKSFGIQIQ